MGESGDVLRSDDDQVILLPQIDDLEIAELAQAC